MTKKYRIWWNSNFGNPAFHKEVKSIEQAKEYLTLLTDYDLYLGDKIESNAGGLEELNSEGDWEEYYNENGESIMDILDELRNEQK